MNLTDDEWDGALTAIEELVDESIDTDNMSAAEALEFCEEVQRLIGNRIAGLREDVK
jgi:hypothetical protein